MSHLFSGPSIPPAPTVSPPAPMPVLNGPAERQARTRRIMEAQQRSGRQSTILSGDSFSGNQLGAD